MRADTDHGIERSALDRVLRLGGTALLARLVAAAIGNFETRRGELARALAESDPAAAERAAHSIKSSAANLGAAELRQAAEAAEALAREGAAGWPAAAAELLAADLDDLRRRVEAAAAAAGEAAASGDSA